MRSRTLTLLAATVSAGLVLTACGASSSNSGGTGSNSASSSAPAGGGANGKVGVILPETASSARWEAFDKPMLQAALAAGLASEGATVVDLGVLPTPTGQPTPVESAEQYFGKSGEPAAGKPKATAKARSSAKAKAAAKARATAKAKQAAAIKAAKHSSGKVSTGSVRTTYAKGKHSSGRYPEGKHAAIARTHGSTDDSSLLAILGIVNAPTDKRK